MIVAAGVGAPNRIYRNSGGTFETVAIGAPSEDSRAVAVGDLNGDCVPGPRVREQRRERGLSEPGSAATFARTPFGSGDARDVVVADLFGDPLPEVVIAYAGSGRRRLSEHGRSAGARAHACDRGDDLGGRRRPQQRRPRRPRVRAQRHRQSRLHQHVQHEGRVLHGEQARRGPDLERAARGLRPRPRQRRVRRQRRQRPDLHERR